MNIDPDGFGQSKMDLRMDRLKDRGRSTIGTVNRKICSFEFQTIDFTSKSKIERLEVISMNTKLY